MKMPRWIKENINKAVYKAKGIVGNEETVYLDKGHCEKITVELIIIAGEYFIYACRWLYDGNWYKDIDRLCGLKDDVCRKLGYV